MALNFIIFSPLHGCFFGKLLAQSLWFSFAQWFFSYGAQKKCVLHELCLEELVAKSSIHDISPSSLCTLRWEKNDQFIVPNNTRTKGSKKPLVQRNQQPVSAANSTMNMHISSSKTFPVLLPGFCSFSAPGNRKLSPLQWIFNFPVQI